MVSVLLQIRSCQYRVLSVVSNPIHLYYMTICTSEDVSLLLLYYRVLPRERGGCAKNSENSGRSRIVRRKGIRAGDEEVVMCMTHRKEKEHDIEVQINSRKVYPAVKRGREVGK